METFHDTIQSESSSEEEAGDDDGNLHNCNGCNKIILNLDDDHEMATEENEWVNIRLEATHDDVLRALEHGCEFAEYILYRAGTLTRTNSNGQWVLCAYFKLHTVDGYQSDYLDTLGFWNEDMNTLEHSWPGDFGVCTPEGIVPWPGCLECMLIYEYCRQSCKSRNSHSTYQHPTIFCRF